MMTVKTKHSEIGYINNIEIIERALRERFGIDDNSFVLRAVATHIWSQIANIPEEELTWGEYEIINAINQCQARLNRMTNVIERNRAFKIKNKGATLTTKKS